MDPHRAERLSTALREELYELINFELEDPRVGPVDIPAIELAPDGRRAIVRVEASDPQSLTALEGARGYLRRELAARLDLFRVPDLKFEAASEIASPERIAELLKRARRGRPRDFGAAQKSPAK
ncbi:MAG: ribosome-binding factor A [Bryobacteraceae bacterium]|nr:ribosome-binding factor A [Bryobacteraceae bacterium]